jgi:SAM-dependent methyltransferase
MITFKSDSDGRISILTGNNPHGLPFKAQPFSMVSDHCTLQFLRPHNPDDVLDSLPEEVYEKDRFLPYWAEQWPSSEVMHSFLQSQSVAAHEKIIELGCGLGIISALASHYSTTVVATDISFDALIFAKTNIELNHGQPKVCCMDWRRPPFKPTFNLLIASDVLYEARWIDPVLACCSQLLLPGGKAWIADPCRSFWKTFKQRAADSGFMCHVMTNEKTGDGRHTIEIVELRVKDTTV